MALEVHNDAQRSCSDETARSQCLNSLCRLSNAGVTVPLRYSRGRWRAPTGTMTVQPFLDAYDIDAPIGIGITPDTALTSVDRAISCARRRSALWSIPYRHPQRDQLLELLAARLPSARGYLFFAPDDGRTAASLLVNCVQQRSRWWRWWPAAPACVRSHCPLLAAEQGRVGMPFAGAVVPPGTAWLPMSLDITDFADRSGRVDRRRLEQTLDVAIEEGDWLLDRVAWSDPATREDARLNRRIALRIEGIGDLVASAHGDPSSFSALRKTDALLATVHSGLWRRSAALAAERGILPVLAERRPNGRWQDDRHRADWTDRWQAAVDRVSVRHRNLLVLTADSLLPRRAPAHPGFTDLLPLLAHADVVGISLKNLPGDWERLDLVSFHARLQAQISRLNATSFVAIGG